MSDKRHYVGVAYLLWGPLGAGPVHEFVASYRRYASGVDHELVVVLNGVSNKQRSALLAPLAGVEHRLLELEAPVQDLVAYAQAAERLDHDLLCCLNSYSVVLVDGWLGMLVGAAQIPEVGLVGATGSWESQAEWRRGSPKEWITHLVGLRARRRDYPRFPNPHIRSTAFVVRRRLLLELGLERAYDKYAAYLLESGRRSITRMIQQRGLLVVVAGSDGRTYKVDEWAASATFRSGGQENLLVADKRTRDWSQASPLIRRRLSRDAWGTGRLSGSRRHSL